MMKTFVEFINVELRLVKFLLHRIRFLLHRIRFLLDWIRLNLLVQRFQLTEVEMLGQTNSWKLKFIVFAKIINFRLISHELEIKLFFLLC